MFFFTVVDPAAPSIEDRASDTSWSATNRLAFARDSVRALNELHQVGAPDKPLVHRRLTPQTILVRHDNSPIFTGFDRTKIPSEVSVASSSLPAGQSTHSIPPEVQSNGLAAADQRSDVFSLCACLSKLFTEGSDELTGYAREILAGGLAQQPDQRGTLSELDVALSELLGDSVPPPPVPPARFWTEDQVVRFHGGDYRIVIRLGSGGVGTTFKVVELDRSSGEELGTYVAKVAHETDIGQSVLRAYGLARSHLGRHEGLSPIHEFAREWQENDFIALLGWIEGSPLSEFTGVFALIAEDQDEPSAEALAIRWIQLMCEAVNVLHNNGLIHGDVSPRNMIVSGASLVLTDYDFVSRIGETTSTPGTISYCSVARQQKHAAAPTDDLFALAASFFHVLFEKEPFRYGGDLVKERGLNWADVDRDQFPVLANVLDKATAADPRQRFATAIEMRQALVQKPAAVQPGSEDSDVPVIAADDSGTEIDSRNNEGVESRSFQQDELSEQHVDWLKSLLQSYPGSRWGNQETRGLDTDFATATYVQTPLEKSLLDDIRKRRVRLVVLCGNAGDGKTALLQHLAQELGLGHHSSSKRILEGNVSSGPRVRMNLDGSAAWQGKSADDLLDEFLKPFENGSPNQDIVHLLAVNDGRLLEWLEGYEERLGEETVLTTELYDLLQAGSTGKQSHIRFISLNERSLVGGISPDHMKIDNEFLEQVIDQLYGGSRTQEIWSPCQSCSAKVRCRVFEAGQMFAPKGFPVIAASDKRDRARQRLIEALQAVHLRGETHITVRELRAALVYILFGIHYCDDYHDGIGEPLPFWDRSFAADSPARQGEVLHEMSRFDPALEAHPQVDRYLLSQPVIDSPKTAPRYDGLRVESARRRAFFEWTSDEIEQVAGDSAALDLARGRHLKLFRELPLAQHSDRLRDITKKLCEGISRLEDLPPQALDREGYVPLRITPRTPTETAFWVEKPLSSFRVEADLPPEVEGIGRLHRQVSLIFTYRDGKQERLRLGAELFHMLLELADGYQLGDVSTDDTFSHLSIFVQRLVREDERELLAWNPMQDEQVYQVSAVVSQAKKGAVQRMVLTPLDSGEKK